MTKDEAIENLREALKRLTQECELDGLRDIAGYDCWLPEAKKVLAATAKIDVVPTGEAVAWTCPDCGNGQTFDHKGCKIFKPVAWRRAVWGGESWLYTSDEPTEELAWEPLYTHAAQPAADPAPVPAQGIDHAKRDIYAELMDGFDALDHAKRAECEHAAMLAGYTKWMHDSSKFPHNNDYRHPSDAFAAGAAWQARGQQAGVPEGGS